MRNSSKKSSLGIVWTFLHVWPFYWNLISLVATPWNQIAQTAWFKCVPSFQEWVAFIYSVSNKVWQSYNHTVIKATLSPILLSPHKPTAFLCTTPDFENENVSEISLKNFVGRCIELPPQNFPRSSIWATTQAD